MTVECIKVVPVSTLSDAQRERDSARYQLTEVTTELTRVRAVLDINIRRQVAASIERDDNSRREAKVRTAWQETLDSLSDAQVRIETLRAAIQQAGPFYCTCFGDDETCAVCKLQEVAA